MPSKKGKNRSSTQRKRGSRDGESSSDSADSLMNDNASVLSIASETSYQFDENEESVEEIKEEEIIIDKLQDVVDLASQKSSNGRISALEELRQTFMTKFIPDFVEDRFLTITDIIERALKKGKHKEQSAACKLSVLLCFQLGSHLSEQIYKALKPSYLSLLNDESSALETRIEVAFALGLNCFIGGEDIAEFLVIMEYLERVYTGSGGGKGSKYSELISLHNACLSSWTLLLTMVPSSRVYEMIDGYLNQMENILDSSDVDFRITAGEAIVILYEISSRFDEEETSLKVQKLALKIKDLSTDSNKHRSKKDRKEQRSSFRDILKTIETGNVYCERISINSRENLLIDSWSKKKHYDILCRTLSSGINLHLTESELVRDIFELGSPTSLLSNSTNKPSKHQRQLVNSQAFKYRTQTRGKERDKRTAAFL